MSEKKLTSQLVQLVMPDATEAELEQATQSWFRFLETIIRIDEKRRRAKADSRAPLKDGSLDQSSLNI